MRPKQRGLFDGDAATFGLASMRHQRARNRKGKIALRLSCRKHDLATMLSSSKIRRDATKLSDTVEATPGAFKDVNGWLSTTAELIKRKTEAERK